MRTPAAAMLWEWWRLTRRQVLFFGVVALLGGWALLARGAETADPRVPYLVFMLLLALAPLAGLAVWVKQPLAGYPLPLAFERPVRTWLLVALPMAYLAAVSAVMYALPALVFRGMFGAPFPMLPVIVLMAAGMAVFAACNWFTRDKAKRLVAAMALFFGLGPSLRWLGVWNGPSGAQVPPPLRTDIVELGQADYALVVIAVAIAYVATVRGVERQRRGDGERQQGRPTLVATAGVAPKGVVEYFRDAVHALVRFRCPTSSALAAELWIETKARGLPVIAIGLLFAMCSPVVLALGNAYRWNGALAFAAIAAFLVFAAGISVSFWNRESTLRAPMSGFEATRPMATARLAAVQVSVAIAAILGAWALLAIGLWLAAPLATATPGVAPLQQALAVTLAASSAAQVASFIFVALVGFATLVALLAAIRAFSVLYGLRLWLGALALAAYGIFFLVAVAADWWGGRVVGAHLWALAATIVLGTAFALRRALVESVLGRKQLLAIAAGWVAFAAVLGWRLHDAVWAFGASAPALVALSLAAALLPMTAAILATWSLALIRHF